MLLLVQRRTIITSAPSIQITTELNVKCLYSCSFVIGLALIAPAFEQGALAQGSQDPTVTSQPGLSLLDPAVPAVANQPAIPSTPVHADKPALMVMGFESGTVSAQAEVRCES